VRACECACVCACVCVCVCVYACVCVDFMYDEGAVYNYFNSSVTRTLSAMPRMCGALHPVSHISSWRRA